MGHQLWISNSGIRRKGTTFKEIQDIFIEKITTQHIYEPLYSAYVMDNALEIRQDLNQRDFDVVGVVDEAKQVIGYVKQEDLRHGTVKDFMGPVSLENVVTDSTPIARLVPLLADKRYVFVMHGSSVEGIVTLADINKPIIRLYLFGSISMFEMHLNFWIRKYYPEESWTQSLTTKRMELAISNFKKRQSTNTALELLDCIQFCDKRDILKTNNQFLTEFNFSREQFHELLKGLESIRNELAHSQSSIIAGLAWPVFVKSISQLEDFLSNSEIKSENENQLPRTGL